MEWTVTEQGGAVIGQPAGRVDETSWEAFADRMTEAVERAALGGARVVIDLSALDYMSSRGLRALTIARRVADEKSVAMVLAAPNEIMREILAISRYDKIFTVAASVEAAL